MTIFYQEDINKGLHQLSEEDAKHCVQVLRKQKGDEIMVFDGKGGKHLSVLQEVSKKKCQFEVISSSATEKKSFSIHLAIAPTKNTDRMEWMIEKLSELGIDEITFLETHHSERRKLRMDRLEKKVISAMKQSGNPWKLKLNELTPFSQFIQGDDSQCKIMGYLGNELRHIGQIIQPNQSVTILVGPEGDFSVSEVEEATQNKFIPVSFGETTLRTETAGLMACCCVNFINQY